MKLYGGGAWMKFRLLMWKNFLQQWRHRIQTVIEILLPALTMSVVLLLRWQVEPSQEPVRTYPPFPATTLNNSALIIAEMNISQLAIAYSPTSPVLDDVVRSAVANLLIENIDLIPDFIGNITIPDLSPDDIAIIEVILKSLIRVEAYDNKEDMRRLYMLEETIRTVIAAVEFDDELYGINQLPINLSYALRFPERQRINSFYHWGGRTWRTDAVFPVFEVQGPRYAWSMYGGNDPAYVMEMFIAIQHMISSQLISRMTGLDLKSFKVYLQRYPHPPYVSDTAIDLLQLMFPMFIMLSFSYTAVNIVRAVTVEKESQLKEVMKIMGLPTWLHWTAWFCKQFLFQLMGIILIVVLLKVNWFTNEQGFSEYAVFTNTPWTILFFYLSLYLTCMIFFSFMMSGFFSKASTAALVAGVVWFLTYIPAFLLSMDIEMSVAVQVITCLSINTAMSYGFQLIISGESTGGMQWGAFFSSPNVDTSRLLFGHVIIMLVVDCVLYMLITLYLEQVLPGPFGAPKPWYFPFQTQFWCSAKKSADDLDLIDHEEDNHIVKEADPKDHEVGVKMHNLIKTFGNNTVVNRLTMNFYDDQITVLLGHNGAGKSTTISMLTGNLEMTHGTINVAGFDIGTQVGAARAHIGFCPQHNVLFNDLTVKEHLEFFARLKGFTGSELKAEIEALIEKLELQEKSDYPSKGLSGGQKRRLCVGIALSGGARVVLLDEPTSGMDPASRRGLWDLLQKVRKGRTMILTTHFMDEADILGDRVAIMAHGKLQCVGSPFFLKRHYGVGYTVVVVKDEGFDCEKCTSLINQHIPNTALKEDRGSEVTYSLLNEYAAIFENMLNDLERNSRDIKFKNYGLLATTLEDVFMSVGSDLAPVSDNSDSDEIATVLTDTTTNADFRSEFNSSLEILDNYDSSVTDLALLMQQVYAIWLKLVLVWTRSWWVVLMQLLVPVLLIVATLGLMEYVMSLRPAARNRPLLLSEGYPRTETLLSYNGTSTSSLGMLAASAYQMIFETSGVDTMELTNVGAEDIDQYYLYRTDNPVDLADLRHQLVIGSTFSDESATAWFSNFGYHDIAISLSAVHSALLKSANPDAIITVSNHPLEATYEDQRDLQLMVSLLAMQLASAIGSSVSIVSAVFIMFYIKERVSGAKLLQKAAGVQPIVLWGSAALFDWSWFIMTCVTMIISCVAFQVVGLSTAAELGRMFLCAMIYGAAMLPLTYLLSLVFKGPALGFVSYFFINVLFGSMGAQVVQILASPYLDTERAAEILDYILQFFPLYSFVTSVRHLNEIGLQEYTCLQMCEPAMFDINCTMEALCQIESTCCVVENPYFNWEEPGVLRYIVCMIISGIVFWIVLMTIEYRLFQKVFRFKKTPPRIDENLLDEDVATEARLAREATPSNYGDHSLLTNDLSKYYGKHLAVDQVSFRVTDGECFGLLGINGAGKTSTFKMLMGDESISSGEAYVSGHSVRKNLNKVHQNIGYCPQFDALFNELTGRETLRVFALMRGLRMSTAMPTAISLSHALGFYKHIDKRVYQYSGGTKRKLNTAVAFLGKSRLLFVDEPTTGVDPVAKRHMWRAVRDVQRAGRGVVLTSHSMEECEALCTRLTIMVNGRFQCLGTPQHLKNKFSQGFTLTIKLKSEETQLSDRSLRRQTSAVKDYVNENFSNPKIMEEYQGLLTYYLPDHSMAWSSMFGIMERSKRELNVEDYTISQTTLEQIFLQFTKYQRLADLNTTQIDSVTQSAIVNNG